MRFYQFVRLACLAVVLITPAASGQVSIRVNNIITVAATGEPIQNGDALLNVLGSIADSGPSNPYHVKLEPGDYNFGNGASVEVKPYVTVEGTGVDTTVIRGTADGALIELMNGSELRFLTVRNEGSVGQNSTIAVRVRKSDLQIDLFARVSHIRAIAGAGTISSAFEAINLDEDTVPGAVKLNVHDSYAEGLTAALRCGGSSASNPLGLVIDGSQLVTSGADTNPNVEGCADEQAQCINSYDSQLRPLPRICFTPPPPITVFVTSATYTGGLGGLAGGDTKCQAHADDAGLSGQWTAWLSSASANAKDRLLANDYHGPYNRGGGAIVANDIADLTDGDLAAAINRNEFEIVQTGINEVWTGTNAFGTVSSASPSSSSCFNWTDGICADGPNGDAGLNNQTTSNWTLDQSSEHFCCDSRRLYCFYAGAN